MVVYSDKIPDCKHFTWHDSCYLPSWQIHHIPSDVEQQNIIATALIMEKIREYLGLPINIHVWMRPILNNPTSKYNGQDYNKLVGGAINSEHKVGNAVDFDVSTLTCDNVRAKLLSKLIEFNIRMENKFLSNWVHVDRGIPHPNRFFIP